MANEAREFLQETRRRIDETLDRLLPTPADVPGRLHEAMRYSALSPGKRLRPALALAACRAFGGDETSCLAPASALEMIHAYSLIHDDLPAMDDDDLRRGQPTCHVKFDEATAILAGDALHSLACEVLATHPEGVAHDSVRARVQRAVLQAIGWRGMVGGQVLDMELTGRGGDASEEDLAGIHRRKTGALIRASLVLGAEIGGAPPSAVEELGLFGDVAGLAFQVVDDVLDVTASSEELGKTGGKDQETGKVTYPAVLGLEAAQQRARELTTLALELLDDVDFPAQGDQGPLRALTTFILERKA